MSLFLPEMSAPSNLLSEAAQIMTARMGVVGLVIGPVLRSWYLTLERIVPGAVKTAAALKRCCWIRVSLLLLWYASFSLCEGHLLENDRRKLMRCFGMLHTDTHDHKLQDLAPCTDSEFYVCSHSAPCLFCPNCSNILECVPSCHGWLTSHNLMLQP